MRADSKALEPAYLLVPEYDYTLGPQVCDVATLAGFAPDSVQELILESVFAERGGLPAAPNGMIVGPRQNFKSGSFEQIFLGWMFVTCEPGAIWSAHLHDTVRGSYEHLCGLIESTPALSRHVVSMPGSPGSEAIVLKGAREDRQFSFVTRTARGKRGRSYGKHLLDEYLYATPEQLGALFPTQSTFIDWQRVAATSAGLATSTEARTLRDRGRPMDRNAEPRLFYLEFCDDLPGECATGAECSHLYGTRGCRYDDEKRWARSNPQAGGRISWDYLRDERRGLTPEIFGRERLGYWDEPGSASLQRLDMDAWGKAEDADSEPVDGTVTFGLDVSPSRKWATIGAAAESTTGATHLEVTSRPIKGGSDLVDHRTGTNWIVPRFRELLLDFPGLRVRLLAKSQAETFAAKLTEIGCTVETVQPGDWPGHVASFLEALTSETLAHLGTLELDAAAESVVLIPVGEEQVRYGRRASGSEIGPIVAVTLAMSGMGEGAAFNIW